MICVEQKTAQSLMSTDLIETHHSGKGSMNKRLALAGKEFWNRESMIEEIGKDFEGKSENGEQR
jgi:hypothetical protein